MCAGVASGSRFRKVPEGSAIKWCWFQRQVPDGSGRFRRVPVCAGVGRRVRRFPRVPVCVGVGSGGRVRKVLESSAVWFVALQPSLDRSSHAIALIAGITVNIVHMGKTIAQKGAHVVKDGKRHKNVLCYCCWGYHQSLFFVASAFRPARPGRCIVFSLSLCTTSRLAPWTRGESSRG